MSMFAKMIIGETTTTGDVAPVMTGAPVISNPTATAARRHIPTEIKGKRNKLRNRMAAGITGQLKEDSRDGYVIPDDAKEVTGFEVAGNGMSAIKAPEVPGQKIKNPYSGEEPLILPAASLVAPDVTPEAIFPLDPSQIPGGDRGQPPAASRPAVSQPQGTNPVVDLMLGKPAGEAVPKPASPMSTESVLHRLPGIPSPGAVALEETTATNETVLSASQPGVPMPEHRGENARAIMDAFSMFVPRGKPILPGGGMGAPSASNV